MRTMVEVSLWLQVPSGGGPTRGWVKHLQGDGLPQKGTVMEFHLQVRDAQIVLRWNRGGTTGVWEVQPGGSWGEENLLKLG